MQNKEKAAASQPRKTTARGQRAPKGVLRRLLRTLFEFYPVLSLIHISEPTRP